MSLRLGFVATFVLCASMVVGAGADVYAAPTIGWSQRGHHSSSSSRSSKEHSSATRSHDSPSHAPRSSSSKDHKTTERHRTSRAEHAPGARDSHGRLARSAKAKDEFERSTGHAGGWKGHVVDHIVPLACGGADSPSNMQWQTTAEAKAKDKTERKGCARR